MLNLIAIDLEDENISTSNLHIFDMVELLVDKYNYKKIDIKKLYDNDINEYLIKTFNVLPNNIFIIKGSSGIHKFKTSNKIKISFFIDDVHPGGSVRKNRRKSLKKTTNVFSTYAYQFNKYYPELNYKLYWLPHSVRFTDIKINENPIKKILITGRLNERVYPNRHKIFKLTKKNKNILYFRPNIGYRIKKSEKNEKHIFGRKFLELLNKFFCGFTCDLIEDRSYLVAKHFEIMGSGCLLLACNPWTKKYFSILGFEDMRDYISCTPENMNEKINFILNSSNYELLDKIRRSGYEKVIKYHNYEIRTEYLHNVLIGEFKNILEYKWK
jgi:hypothetical protein